MIINLEIAKDFANLLKVFDVFLDDMYDRGHFDPAKSKSDKEISDFVDKLKDKYSKVPTTPCNN